MSVRVYAIIWKGRLAHVDAEVSQTREGRTRVEVFSITFDDHDREPKTFAAETVYKNDFDQATGKPNTRAFAQWSSQDRKELYGLVREADARGAQA